MSSVNKDLMSQKGSLVSLYVKPRKRWGKFKCSKWRSDRTEKKAVRFYSAWFSSCAKNSLLAARRRTFTWSVARKGNWAALGLDLSAHIRSISRIWVVQVSGKSLNFYLRNFVCWDSDLCNFVCWDSVMKKTFPPLTGPRAKVLPQGKLSVLTWKL